VSRIHLCFPSRPKVGCARRPNPSIERTSQGLRPCAASHVKRYTPRYQHMSMWSVPFKDQRRLKAVTLWHDMPAPERRPAELTAVRVAAGRRFTFVRALAPTVQHGQSRPPLASCWQARLRVASSFFSSCAFGVGAAYNQPIERTSPGSRAPPLM
jgi:hypothetical protein